MYVCVHAYVRMHVHMYACMYVCMYPCMYVFACIRTYMYDTPSTQPYIHITRIYMCVNVCENICTICNTYIHDDNHPHGDKIHARSRSRSRTMHTHTHTHASMCIHVCMYAGR